MRSARFHASVRHWDAHKLGNFFQTRVRFNKLCGFLNATVIWVMQTHSEYCEPKRGKVFGQLQRPRTLRGRMVDEVAIGEREPPRQRERVRIGDLASASLIRRLATFRDARFRPW